MQTTKSTAGWLSKDNITLIKTVKALIQLGLDTIHGSRHYLINTNSQDTWPGSHSALAMTGHHMCIQTRGCRYSLELLLMSGFPLKTCWAFNKLWNNKFCYKAASCLYFYWVLNYVLVSSLIPAVMVPQQQSLGWHLRLQIQLLFLYFPPFSSGLCTPPRLLLTSKCYHFYH